MIGHVTILAVIYGDPKFFGPRPGCVNRTQSYPGLILSIRSDPIQVFVNAPINLKMHPPT